MERHQGFTLIEVSIVLVLIGLLAGGILAGQELIHGSTLRSVVSQKEQIEAATNTFRNKYNGLPGDLTHATSFGFGANGNGDGKIGQFMGVDYDEVWGFFEHLSQAELIPGEYTGTNGPSGARHAVPGTNVPASKFPNAGFMVVGWFGYTNAFDYIGPGPRPWTTIQFHALLFGTTYLSQYETFGPILSASDALSIDLKFDDGLPASGAFIAPNIWSCATSNINTNAKYRTSTSNPRCSFYIRLSF
jgi:prepilin-type N-terminal cleavage/methylation domain-containing protein